MIDKSKGPAPTNRKQAPMEVIPNLLCHLGQPGEATIPKALLSIEEAGHYLSVSRNTIYKLLDLGELTRVRIPGIRRVAVRVDELDQLIDEGGAQ